MWKVLVLALLVSCGCCGTGCRPGPPPPIPPWPTEQDPGFERTPLYEEDESSLLAPSLASAASPCPTVSAPIRASAQDVSIKYPRETKFKWFRGCTADQVQRDALQEALFAVYIPQVYAYGLTMPACRSANKGAVSQLGNIAIKLATAYEQKSILPSGHWQIGEDGRHYQKEDYVLTDYRKCSLGDEKACAANPLMTKELQDLLNIRIEGGKCVANALFPVWCDNKDSGGMPCLTPLEPFDVAKANAGLIDNNPAQPVRLSAATLALCRRATELHGQGTDAACKGTTPPPTGSVQAAHVACEAACTAELGARGHHFCRMKDFGGCKNDPRWTPAEVCKIKTLEHEMHHRWFTFLEAGDWGHARQADDYHQLAHLGACMKEAIEMRFACGVGGLDRAEKCDVQTILEKVATL